MTDKKKRSADPVRELPLERLEKLGAETAREMLGAMFLIRAFEEKAEALYGLGKVHGTMHLSLGQEG